MASYRFCRSDDVPLLLRAYEECFDPPGGAAALDLDGFRWWIRALELWTSSCMVATEGRRLIGVLLAAKRETENCVLAVGVHPEFRRLGHGRHLMTSLSSKLAILGPPRILAEVPAADARCARFLRRCDYRERLVYTDYTLEPPAGRVDLPAEMIGEISLDELDGAGFPESGDELPWARRPRAIRRRQEFFGTVRVLALAGVERFEAALVIDEHDPSARRILAVRHAGDDRSVALAGRLLRHYASRAGVPVVWERVADSECPADRAAAWALRAGPGSTLFETVAAPA